MGIMSRGGICLPVTPVDETRSNVKKATRTHFELVLGFHSPAICRKAFQGNPFSMKALVGSALSI